MKVLKRSAGTGDGRLHGIGSLRLRRRTVRKGFAFPSSRYSRSSPRLSLGEGFEALLAGKARLTALGGGKAAGTASSGQASSLRPD